MEFQYKELHQMADRLISLGYEVYVTESKGRTDRGITYFHYGNDKGVAYIQQDRLSGTMELSSDHIPAKEVGSGYRIEEFLFLDCDESILANALTFVCPYWDSVRSRFVKKYKSITDFVEISNKKWAQIQKLVKYNG